VADQAISRRIGGVQGILGAIIMAVNLLVDITYGIALHPALGGPAGVATLPTQSCAAQPHPLAILDLLQRQQRRCGSDEYGGACCWLRCSLAGTSAANILLLQCFLKPPARRGGPEEHRRCRAASAGCAGPDLMIDWLIVSVDR
jgi:hypothetical protein